MYNVELTLADHRRRAIRAALFLGLAAVSTPAGALSCAVTPQSVLFGSYDTLAPNPVDGVGTIRVSCDAEATFTISVGPGSGSYEAREMRNGADPLRYNLYTDAARLVVWGDGSTGGSTVSGSGTSVDFPIYGRIPAQQNVKAGSYYDVIMITVSF